MGDKFDGALAGGGRNASIDVGLSEAFQNLSLHEILVACDEAGHLVLLRAVQNPYHGGIMIVAEKGELNSPAMADAIKLSQMTSMLNDNDRCDAYASAISKVLADRPDSRVLDIGTGTGLLAMMAARAGAAHVEAIEMFHPLAELANQVIQGNSLDERITVHAAKSTSLSVHNDSVANCDESRIRARSDVLVTEIFDSSLLGEGCLPVIAHARNALLNGGAAIIPSKAVLHGVIVNSDLFSRFQKLGAEFPFHRSADARNCRGGGKGIPMHLDALQEEYEVLSEQFEIFEFNFSDEVLVDKEERIRQLHVRRTREGMPTTILTWWTLDLTGTGEVRYSSEPGAQSWQDHWLPVCYPLCVAEEGEKSGETILLTAGHDLMSFWFALGDKARSSATCSCGFHALPGGPYRVFELGDSARINSLQARIRMAVREAEESIGDEGRVRCIDVSDSSICGLLASQVHTKRELEVLSVEEDSEFSAHLYGQVEQRMRHSGKERAKVNVIQDSLSAIVRREAEAKNEQSSWQGFNVMLSEPYTRAMQAYPLATLGNLIVQRNALQDVLASTISAVPRIACVKMRAIRFAPGTMQKAFGAVKEASGFDHSPFAELYADWQGKQRISLPLFQYVTEDVSREEVLFEFDLCEKLRDTTFSSQVNFTSSTQNSPDAVVLWVEYDGDTAALVGRSEVLWLGEDAKRAIVSAHGISVTAVFRLESGTFDVNFEHTL